MKRVTITPDGELRCPSCGARSFDSKSTLKGKLAGGLLFARSRLRCQGCGDYLKRKPRKVAA